MPAGKVVATLETALAAASEAERREVGRAEGCVCVANVVVSTVRLAAVATWIPLEGISTVGAVEGIVAAFSSTPGSLGIPWICLDKSAISSRRVSLLSRRISSACSLDKLAGRELILVRRGGDGGGGGEVVEREGGWESSSASGDDW